MSGHGVLMQAVAGRWGEPDTSFGSLDIREGQPAVGFGQEGSRSSIGGLVPSYHQVGRKKRRARPGGPLVYDEQQDGDVPWLHRGEADTVRPRVDSHGQRLAFWERAIVLTAGSPLNKAHVK